MADVHDHDDYHARRAAQERAAADRSTDAWARRLHLDLAERHAAQSRLHPAA